MARFKPKAQIEAEQKEAEAAVIEASNEEAREEYLRNKFKMREEEGLSVPDQYKTLKGK